MSGHRSLRRCRRGVTSVEFALVGLLLLTWIFGIIEAARAFWTYQIIEEVAIEGARCMAVLAPGCSASGAYSASAAQTFIIGVASNRGLTLTATNLNLAARPANCAGTGGFSKVTITYQFTTVVPVLLPDFQSLQLSSTACSYNSA